MAQKRKEYLRFLKHQLKTPLTLVRGYLSFWENGSYEKFPPEKQKEFILKAADGARTLDTMLNDIFLALILEKEKPDVHPEPLRLMELATAAAAQASALHPEKKIDIAVASEPDAAPFSHDTLLVQFLFRAVFDELYKSATGGNVRISLKETARHCIIKIIVTDVSFNGAAFIKNSTLPRTSLPLHTARILIKSLRGSMAARGSEITIKLPNLAEIV